MLSAQPNENRSLAGDANTQEILNKLALSEADLTEQNRSSIDIVLKIPPKWADIAYYLYINNPDKAKDFLVRLLKIDANAPEADKTTELLNILHDYSDHSVLHSSEVADFMKNMNELKNTTGFDAFRDIDFEKLASSMKSHDVGKLGMPDRILNPRKSIEYTDADNKIKETHPVLSYIILKALGFNAESQRSALTHHLRYKTVNDELKIVGYPVNDFRKYCDERGEEFQLTAEDHFAAFADVFSALTDPNRPSNKEGTNTIKSIKERYESAFKVMEEKNIPEEKRKYFAFGDDFYTKGKGAALYSAFKRAMLKSLEHISLAA